MAACVFKFSSHQYHVETNTHTHIYIYIIGGEINYFRTAELFCLVHPCLFFFSLSLPFLPFSLSLSLSLSPSLPLQQMGYFNEISLACSHLCEKWISPFFKWGNLQWDRLERRGTQRKGFFYFPPTPPSLEPIRLSLHLSLRACQSFSFCLICFMFL